MRIIAAVGVLLGGIVVAFMFRHESPPRQPPTPGQDGPLLLRKDPGTMPAHSATTQQHAGNAASRPATIVTPGTFTEPPRLTQDHPGLPTPEKPRWGRQRNMMPAANRRPSNSPQTHKIVDGDTLESLAERYLGSADRYREIYEANRNLLPSPQLLPIGVKLKIPPEGIKVLHPSNMMPRRRLVPLYQP